MLPRSDAIWGEALNVKNLRAVGHEGQVTGISRYTKERIVEVSAPGVYELYFEGVGADRFLPIPPQRVQLRAGETAELIVELHRK